MEGPLQVKDSVSATAEPIKSEGVVQNSDSSERSEEASSPPPNCSICLGKLINTSFTDSCLHQFCFNCLLQWSKIKTECPLCKQTFKSIIHNVRSEEDYDQYHVPRELASQIPQPPVMTIQHLDDDYEEANWVIGPRRCIYGTTITDSRRRVIQNAEQATRERILALLSEVPREEQRTRRINPTLRRAIYTHGIWATSLPGRFQECSADYYRRFPRELDRLIPWLNRELQILISNRPTHIPYVLRIIMNALTLHDIRSLQFQNIVRPYFGVHTEHFIHELFNFAGTNYDIVAYDQAVTYLFQGLSREYVPHVVSPVSSSSSTSSDDSDVHVLDEAIDLRVNTEIPGVAPRPVNMPGPSTVAQAFHMEIPYNVPDVLTISSGSSDDECEVICYVKPRHERTPEIIELNSSDPEDTNTPYVSNDNPESVRTTLNEDVPQASTSFNSKKGLPTKVNSENFRTSISESSSSSSDNSSDSDYNPRRSRKCRGHAKKSSKKKVNNKRRKHSNAKNRKRVDRSVSSSGESDFRNKSSRRSSQHGKVKQQCSSSESSLEEDRKKKSNETKSRKEIGSLKATAIAKMRRAIIKKEVKYNEDNIINNSSSSSSSSTSSSSSSSSSSTTSTSSSSSTSSSDTSNESKEARKYELLKQKSRSKDANCSPVWVIKYDADKIDKEGKNKGKSRLMIDKITSLDDSSRKNYKYKENKRSRTRSTSKSPHLRKKNRKSTCKKRQVHKCKNEYESEDANKLSDTMFLKRESSTRSNSQISNYSDNQYNKYKRRSKHSCKDKKKRRSRSKSRSRSRSISRSRSRSKSSRSSRSPSRSRNRSRNKSRSRSPNKSHSRSPNRSRSRSRSSFRSRSSTSNSSLTNSIISFKSETCSVSKHSDSKNSLSNKEKRRSHKSHKKSKYRRSRSKSRSKRGFSSRTVRWSYSSNTD